MLLFLMIFVFFAALIANRYAEKLHNKIVQLFLEECDPYQYIDRYQKILKRRLGKIGAFVLVNLSSGYLAAGNPQKAKQILDSIGSFQENQFGLQNKSFYYNNLCSYYLMMNDITNAEIMLENMLNSLQNEKFPKMQYYALYNCYTETRYEINIAKGNYVGTEDIFLIKYNREKSKLGKVESKYQLGKIYLHYNRIGEARSAFEYVINNGNKTYYVDESKELLNQCNDYVVG